MCQVTEACNRPNLWWIQTNLPKPIKDIREATGATVPILQENGTVKDEEQTASPERSIFACNQHLAMAVRQTRCIAIDVIERHKDVYRTSPAWAGILVKAAWPDRIRNGETFYDL